MKEFSFYDNVYDVVRLIPVGRVTTYGSIANYLGTKRSARMVGWALNSTIGKGLDLPAHRVINRKGILTGKNYFSNPVEMQELLEKEGVIVRDDLVQNFKDIFWDPSHELL
jgi:methylated-DNA-protein-cysteine methyltransferase-like protein